MTYLEIYQNVKRLIPPDLREKYDHLSYGEMAEVEELSQWAEGCAGQRHSGRRSHCRMNSQALKNACKATAERRSLFLCIPRARTDKWVAHSY